MEKWRSGGVEEWRRNGLMSFLVMFLLCLAAPLPAIAQGAPVRTNDESAVREVVRKYVEARERRDASAIRALFTEDADQLTSSGEWRRGREEVVKGTLASSASNAGTRTITIDTVRFPASGVALADGAYTIASGASTRNMRASFVMVRSGDAWRISAIRNMLPAPPAGERAAGGAGRET
jgi:uncharacterized protein (TIGR02246 family)